jgi:uroporphyrinogen-III decarboxylase
MIETVFNPWNVAQKLSSKEEVLRLKQEKPQALLDALDAITQSEVAHAKRALAAGASGVLFSIANANSQELSVADYEKFSRPFDKRFLEGISGARLNFMQSARRAGVFEPVPRLYGSGDQLLAACIRRPNHGGAAAVSHLGRGGRH